MSIWWQRRSFTEAPKTGLRPRSSTDMHSTDYFVPISLKTSWQRSAGSCTWKEEVYICSINPTCAHSKWYSQWVSKGCFKPYDTCKGKLCHCSFLLNLNFLLTDLVCCKHWCVIKNTLLYKSCLSCRRLQHFYSPSEPLKVLFLQNLFQLQRDEMSTSKETVMKSTLAEHKTTSLRLCNDWYLIHFCNCHLKIHNTDNKVSTFYDYPTSNFINVCKQGGKIVPQLFDLESYFFSLELTGRAISLPRKSQVLVHWTCSTLRNSLYIPTQSGILSQMVAFSEWKIKRKNSYATHYIIE